VDVRVVVEVVLSVVWARMRERKERSEKRASVGRCIFVEIEYGVGGWV